MIYTDSYFDLKTCKFNNMVSKKKKNLNEP